jgi:head-tail adaptor
MPAGQLREKVTFQRPGQGAGDGAGNYGTAFADITGAIGVHAQLKPIRAGEVVLAEGVQGRRLYEVIVRHTSTLAGITVGDRMVDTRDAARVFNVTAPPVNNDMRNKYLTILVELGGASG